MRKSTLTISMFVVIAVVLSTSAAKPVVRKKVTNRSIDDLLKLDLPAVSEVGGLLKKSGKGKFVLFSSQGKYSDEDVKALADSFGEQFKFKLETVRLPEPVAFGKGPAAMKQANASVAMFLCDDPALPMSLVAMEERWAMVNVAHVYDATLGREAGRKRLRREMSRAFKALFAGLSARKDTTAVADGRDLDALTGDPIDGQTLFNIVHGLPSYGLVSEKVVTYKKACEEGWAPAPTNDVQRKIWDKVHAIPQKPIKIEYNEKRDKGK